MIRTIVILFMVFPVAGQAKQLRDVPYGTHQDQSFDVYLPDAPQNAPLIVMLHGGAWRIGDKSNQGVWQEKSDYWNAKGYIFISTNTRLLPDADPIEQTRDLAKAVALIQQKAKRWGGDPSKLVLIGHSAGGHVVSLLATRGDLRREAGLLPWRGTVSLDAGGLDVEKVMNSRPPRLYRKAFGRDPKFWTAANPTAHADTGEGPFLIVCSVRRVSACRDGASLAAKVEAASLLRVDMSHREINSELGKPSVYTKTIDTWITKALRR